MGAAAGRRAWGAGFVLVLSVCAPGLCLPGRAWAQEHPPSPQSGEEIETALGAPKWLSIDLQVRTRYETLSRQLEAGRSGGDEALTSQLSLRAEARGERFALVGELIDARLLAGNDGGAAAQQVDALEPLQAYLALSPTPRIEMDFGRFTQDLGSRRLISRSAFSNTITAFDGVRVTASPAAGAHLTALYVKPTTRRPDDIGLELDNEAGLNATADSTRLWGAHAAFPLGGAMSGETYALRLEEKDASDLETRNRRLWTYGVRLRQTAGPSRIDVDLEWIGQSGRSRAASSAADLADLDHRASFVHAEAGYTFALAGAPRVSISYDNASGDRSPTDGKTQRFDTLYGDRSFELGPTALYGLIARTNLDSLAARIDIQPDARTDANLTLRNMRLDSASDSFGGTRIRDASGASGRQVGVQVDGRMRWWAIPKRVRIEAGAAFLFAGSFLERAPNAPTRGDIAYSYTTALLTY